MLNAWLSCKDDCDYDVFLPAIPAVQECTNYDILDSQVCDLVIVPMAADDPFDWTSGTPVLKSGGINNAVTDNSSAKRLVVEGGVPVPEKNIEELDRNRRFVSRRVYTLTATVRNMEQYELIRKFQCNWTLFRFYFFNLGGFMFGPQGGIRPLFVDADLPLGAARGDKMFGQITIQFEADGDTDRWALSISDSDFEVEELETPEVIGDPDSGEGWGDPDSGEVWGWQ